jgi:hypothetical protein
MCLLNRAKKSFKINSSEEGNKETHTQTENTKEPIYAI